MRGMRPAALVRCCASIDCWPIRCKASVGLYRHDSFCIQLLRMAKAFPSPGSPLRRDLLRLLSGLDTISNLCIWPLYQTFGEIDGFQVENRRVRETMYHAY